ncbi:hypothetical protein [Sinomicrobium sp. M5D2P17]
MDNSRLRDTFVRDETSGNSSPGKRSPDGFIHERIKKTAVIVIPLFFVLFSACNFNQSAKKDLTSGAYSRGDGIDCDEVVIQASGKAEKKSHFVYGEKVNFVFNDIQGLKKEGDRVFPGLSMFITKNEKDTVLAYPDLLDNIKEGTTLSPLQLQANFTAALPCKDNEKYKVHINIWDKKGEGTFLYELPFAVEESKLLAIHSEDISYSNIYLWNESLKQPVLEDEINQEDELILILEGLSGLTVENENVYPVLSLNIEDTKGNQILSTPNVLSKYEHEGIDAESVTNSKLYATITFFEAQINNPYQLTAILKDKKSDTKIEITAELNLK